MTIMASAAIIMVANHRVPVQALNQIIASHRQHVLRPTIVVAYVGEPAAGIMADLIVPVGGPMSLAKPRNAAARSCVEEWLIFSDADTFYTRELEGLLVQDRPVARGCLRADVSDFQLAAGSPYGVVAAPMIVRRDIFEAVGGYHEGYYNYGHEDLDLISKLGDCPAIYAGAIHVLAIHQKLAGPDWRRGVNNAELYRRRMALPVARRIAQDRATYFQRSDPPTDG